MRAFAVLAVIGSLTSMAQAADKLSMEDKIELTRGLSFEYANAKVLIPRSKKPLEFDAKAGTFDKKEWATIAKESGPAARTGDSIQITKVDIEDDKLVLQINGGFKGGRKWYQGVTVAGGGNMPVPVASGGDSNSPGGTSILVQFHKSLEGVKALEVKKMLAAILDFDPHSVTQIYSETLSPEMQAAIKEKRALVGMDRDQVRMAIGQPLYKSRETKDGLDIEDWVYGKPPGKITFVTFGGEKVIKVKDDYAGLGTDVGVVKQ
jgi:hypothetical protein